MSSEWLRNIYMLIILYNDPSVATYLVLLVELWAGAHEVGFFQIRRGWDEPIRHHM